MKAPPCDENPSGSLHPPVRKMLTAFPVGAVFL